MSLLHDIAKRIPEGIRKHLLEEKLIEKAVNIQSSNSPMEYIFDVYEEFIDIKGDHDDWTCHRCRQHVLQEMQKLRPILEELQSQTV